MALHSAILPKQRIGKPMGGELHGAEKPCVRWRLQPRTDIDLNTVGGICGLHVSAPAQTSALTCMHDTSKACPLGSTGAHEVRCDGQDTADSTTLGEVFWMLVPTQLVN